MERQGGWDPGAASLRSESTLQGVYSQAEEDLKRGYQPGWDWEEKPVHRWSLSMRTEVGNSVPREGGFKCGSIHVSAGP